MTDLKCVCEIFDSHAEFQHDKRKIVSCSDKGSRAVYRYDNQIRQDFLSLYRIDGGLITDNDPKCDRLLINCNKRSVFFIELKGCDLEHAVKQIDRSVKLMEKKLIHLTVHARIVLSRVNTTSLRSSEYIKFENRIRQLGGTVKKESRQMTEVNS